MSNKEVVKEFFETNIFNNPARAAEFLHPELQLIWRSSTGRKELNFNETVELMRLTSEGFHDSRIEITHLIEEGDMVASQFILYVNTIENPDEELRIAHFQNFYELKDNKLYRGWWLSQPVE